MRRIATMKSDFFSFFDEKNALIDMMNICKKLFND